MEWNGVKYKNMKRNGAECKQYEVNYNNIKQEIMIWSKEQWYRAKNNDIERRTMLWSDEQRYEAMNDDIGRR